MKKLRYFLLIVLVLPLCLIFSGCGSIYVSKIEKTGSNGNTDILTIYYSDGSTSTITIENGKDGKDGADLDLLDLFNQMVKEGVYQENEYNEFLKDYVNNRVEKSAGIFSAMNSVVRVYCNYGNSASAGSGVVYEMDDDYAYIVTNAHVVTKSSDNGYSLPTKIGLWQYGKELNIATTYQFQDFMLHATYGINATCVGYSVEHDIAILKVDAQDLLKNNKYTCAVTLADGYTLGESVFAIGNPLAEGISVTRGIISVTSEFVNAGGIVLRTLRTDVSIYSGSSGGGLFNDNGELVGITNGGKETEQSINCALPIDNVKFIVENLLYYSKSGQNCYGAKYVDMDKLGASLDETEMSYNPEDGTLSYTVVVDQLSNGVLGKRDMRVGDVITALIIDGETYNITRFYQVDDYLLKVRANSSVTFNVTRKVNGETISASVNLLTQDISNLL